MSESLAMSPMVIVAIMITAVIASRVLNERGMRLLGDAEKARLVDAFSSLRMVGLIPLAAMAAFYFAAGQFPGMDARTSIWWMCCGAVGFGVGMQYFVWRRLKQLDFPDAYIRLYLAGRILVLTAGAVVLAAIV